MAAVWSDQNKFQRWLDVEVAACEAWAELGQIPREAAEKIRRDAGFDVDKINEYIRSTHHDVTAFLRSVAETLGEEGRYVHFGLTSSDVWDTATGLQLRDACDLLLPAHALVIEVVGGVHALTTERDAARRAVLEAQGLSVITLPNEQLYSGEADGLFAELLGVRHAA